MFHCNAQFEPILIKRSEQFLFSQRQTFLSALDDFWSPTTEMIFFCIWVCQWKWHHIHPCRALLDQCFSRKLDLSIHWPINGNVIISAEVILFIGSQLVQNGLGLGGAEKVGVYKGILATNWLLHSFLWYIFLLYKKIYLTYQNWEIWKRVLGSPIY